MNKYLRKTVCLIALIAIPSMSLAATKAWIIGSKTAIKLNVKDSVIEKQQSIDIYRGRYFYDKKTGNLFVIQGMGRFDTVINVYDIKTFQQKGQLEIEIDNSVSREAQLLIPNSGNLFYLRWLKMEGSAPEIIAYDATTLKPVNKYQTNPPTTKQLMLSQTGDRLYSLVFGGGVLRLDYFQTSDFTYKSTVDIKQFFTLGSEGGVTDLFAEKALVDEVISRTPQLDCFEYIYDASTNTISQKIRTTLIGSDYLIPMTNKIALHEEQYVGKFKSMSLKSDYKPSGNIHIFDAASGKKVATVKVAVAQDGKFLGVTPLEDKLYFVSNGVDSSNPMLHVIDLKSYTVVKTLPLPETSGSIVFYEE
jgi:hypothetical protein